ncbi:tetratricopeptide repeat protein [Novosphingobium sp.]|uniref:tetratricopeptide repeat protein n=1 Tax=Novosphingobium sp. TaxID=1874826 RepID=UPI0035B190E8
MSHPLKHLALVGIGLTTGSFSVETRFTDAELAALDPVRAAETVCGGQRVGSVLTAQLLIASAQAAPISEAASMPLYPDLANSPFPVTTGNNQARRYFSQGLLLNYGFNHSGAVRSFRQAQRLDPNCAMCWWGEALALGPNINAPMDDRDRDAALTAMDRAMALRFKASPLERALIEAVALRYSRDPAADRAVLDAAYADAMLKVAHRFPADDDVAVLAAEAAMDTTPWNYWEPDRKTPIGLSGAALRLVEAVLARNPSHVQAGHLAIHLLEASDPQRAEGAADRLARPIAPSAAHLVHMPGHIFYARGRYADSMRVNVAAARADEAYLRTAGDSGLVRYGYYPHNIHFIVTSAQMAGDMATAIREAQRLRTILSPETSAKIAWIQAIDAAPFFAMAQFAAPEDILALPAPDARLPYARAMWHYARSVAHAVRQDGAAFDAEMQEIDTLAKAPALDAMVAQGMPVHDLLALAQAVARGRLAVLSGRHDEAIAHYRKAVGIESKIPYQEPPYWYYPVRQSLGAALFLAGRHDEASQVFREALVQSPRNGWALFGLARSEAARGNKLEAAAARRAFSKVWLGEQNWPQMERL